MVIDKGSKNSNKDTCFKDSTIEYSSVRSMEEGTYKRSKKKKNKSCQNKTATKSTTSTTSNSINHNTNATISDNNTGTTTHNKTTATDNNNETTTHNKTTTTTDNNNETKTDNTTTDNTTTDNTTTDNTTTDGSATTTDDTETSSSDSDDTDSSSEESSSDEEDDKKKNEERLHYTSESKDDTSHITELIGKSNKSESLPGIKSSDATDSGFKRDHLSASSGSSIISLVEQRIKALTGVTSTSGVVIVLVLVFLVIAVSITFAAVFCCCENCYNKKPLVNDTSNTTSTPISSPHDDDTIPITSNTTTTAGRPPATSTESADDTSIWWPASACNTKHGQRAKEPIDKSSRKSYYYVINANDFSYLSNTDLLRNREIGEAAGCEAIRFFHSIGQKQQYDTMSNNNALIQDNSTFRVYEMQVYLLTKDNTHTETTYYYENLSNSNLGRSRSEDEAQIDFDHKNYAISHMRSKELSKEEGPSVKVTAFVCANGDYQNSTFSVNCLHEVSRIFKNTRSKSTIDGSDNEDNIKRLFVVFVYPPAFDNREHKDEDMRKRIEELHDDFFPPDDDGY